MSANMRTFPFSGRSKLCGDCEKRLPKGKWFRMQFRNLYEVRSSMQSGQIQQWRREHCAHGCQEKCGCPWPWRKTIPVL